MGNKQFHRPTERIFQSLAVVRTTHSKIGEMMQVFAENRIAIARVGARIDDVGVPKLVDGSRRADF